MNFKVFLLTEEFNTVLVTAKELCCHSSLLYLRFFLMTVCPGRAAKLQILNGNLMFGKESAFQVQYLEIPML